MPEGRGPSSTAVLTAAAFTGGSLAILAGGGVLGLFLWKHALLMLLVWGGTGVAFVGRVVGLSKDPAFLEAVARDSDFLSAPPSRAVLERSGGGLSGKYLEGFDRVRQLKDGLAGEIKGLPEGPGKQAFLEYLPQLDETTEEVHRLSLRMQELERSRPDDITAKLRAEIEALRSRIATTEDAAARSELSTALAKKEQALAHYAKTAGGQERLSARVEAIAAALQEGRARVAALKGTLDDPMSFSPAKLAVEGISREVKYLSQTVEETTKLLS